ARCSRTGQLGIAVASSSPCVAARCTFASAGVGAVATQNVTDPRLGPRGLDLMALGASVEDAVRILRASAPHAEYRQVAAIDASGRVAGFSGTQCLGVHGLAECDDAIAAGNLLANHDVPRAIVSAFAAAPEADLGDRIVDAMLAGLAAGGEAGPLRSAGMLLVGKMPRPGADLRGEWHHDPPCAPAPPLALWQPPH